MAGTNKQGPQEGQSKEQERQKKKKDEGEKNATTSEKKKKARCYFYIRIPWTSEITSQWYKHSSR